MTSLLSILSMYFFIVIGFSAKKIFKDDINAKTLNLLSVYFLQPFLTLWGLTLQPFDHTLFLAPLWYLLIVIGVLIFSYIVVNRLFQDPHERSIARISALIGNTGNLGIPLGIALFGMQGVPYMTLINLMNIFIVYTLGVYIYSRGNFSVKQSLANIVALPILWFAILAILLNINAVTLPKQISNMLMMGAYAAMVVQLLVFGIYLKEVKLKALSKKLFAWVMGVKFIVLPVVTVFVLSFSGFTYEVKAMIFLELFMPLAVANINISALYGAKPEIVTGLVFISSILFLPFVFVVGRFIIQ